MPRSRSSASECLFKTPGVALLIVLLVAAQSHPVSGGAAGTAVIRAASGTLTSGAPGPAAILAVEVTNVQSLGAATVLVAYDPTMLKATACQRGSRFEVGLCNQSYDRNGDGVPDAVLFNVLSLGGVNATQPVGLANITWQAVAAVEEPTAVVLAVQVQTFTDVDAQPLAYAAQDGLITLLPVPPLRKVFLPLLARSP